MLAFGGNCGHANQHPCPRRAWHRRRGRLEILQENQCRLRESRSRERPSDGSARPRLRRISRGGMLRRIVFSRKPLAAPTPSFSEPRPSGGDGNRGHAKPRAAEVVDEPIPSGTRTRRDGSWTRRNESWERSPDRGRSPGIAVARKASESSTTPDPSMESGAWMGIPVTRPRFPEHARAGIAVTRTPSDDRTGPARARSGAIRSLGNGRHARARPQEPRFPDRGTVIGDPGTPVTRRALPGSEVAIRDRELPSRERRSLDLRLPPGTGNCRHASRFGRRTATAAGILAPTSPPGNGGHAKRRRPMGRSPFPMRSTMWAGLNDGNGGHANPQGFACGPAPSDRRSRSRIGLPTVPRELRSRDAVGNRRHAGSPAGGSVEPSGAGGSSAGTSSSVRMERSAISGRRASCHVGSAAGPGRSNIS